MASDNAKYLDALVLDSVSSPITRRVYNLGLDETRISFPAIEQSRNTIPAFGFGPFQNGSRKNATALRTASWDETASTFVAYWPRGPVM
jgi:hypothetical protein